MKIRTQSAGIVAAGMIVGWLAAPVEGRAGEETAEDARNACAPADLVPVPLDFPGSGFCRINDGGHLEVRVRNQGAADAPTSRLRVTFDVQGSAVPVEATIPALGAGASADVEMTGGAPRECDSPEGCDFQIVVDVKDDVRPEVDQDNNIVLGRCMRPADPDVAYLTVTECLMLGGEVKLWSSCAGTGLKCTVRTTTGTHSTCITETEVR